jgi:hypothetical protein
MLRRAVLLAALALPVFISQADAQFRVNTRPTPYRETRFEITGIGGWQFGGSVPTTRGDISTKDSWAYGVVLNISLRPGTQFEAFYLRQDTTLRLRGFNGGDLFDASLNYWQAGAVYLPPAGNPDLQPLVGLTLGINHIAPQDAQTSSETRFAMAFEGGVKYFLGDRLALRFQGQLLSTFWGGGSSIWVGPGGGYVTLGGYGAIQGNVMAGLTLAFQ